MSCGSATLFLIFLVKQLMAIGIHFISGLEILGAFSFLIRRTSRQVGKLQERIHQVSNIPNQDTSNWLVCFLIVLWLQYAQRRSVGLRSSLNGLPNATSRQAECMSYGRAAPCRPCLVESCLAILPNEGKRTPFFADCDPLRGPGGFAQRLA